MIGLMANSGLSTMDRLSHAATENINIDPQVDGVIIPADRGATDRICAAIKPDTPYVPIPGAIGCWEFICLKVNKAREYHRKLQPWLPAFDAEVSAAMNAVIMSQLSMTCEENRQVSNRHSRAIRAGVRSAVRQAINTLLKEGVAARLAAYMLPEAFERDVEPGG